MASKQFTVELGFDGSTALGILTLTAEAVTLLGKNPNYHIAFSHMRDPDTGDMEIVGASLVDNKFFVKDVKNKDL